MKLCKCNNCESILIDENPQIGAKELEVPGNAKEMIQVQEDGGTFFWACPECKTDEYLMDIEELITIK